MGLHFISFGYCCIILENWYKLQLQRLVNRQEFELSTSQQGVKEITLDCGKVRLRNEKEGESCYWKAYKAVCLDNVYSGAFFQNNQDLID